LAAEQDGSVEDALMALVRAIVAGDPDEVSRLVDVVPVTETARADVYLEEIEHHLYRGDTALHLAAASHRPGIARLLVARGADVDARNRRGAQPLHYAADGVPGSGHWDPAAQAETVRVLIEMGADPNARDNNGVAPLHRAVRTRCSAAVGALLDGGADPGLANGSGSTPMDLATRATGRGGSGSSAAKAEQARIVDELQRRTGR
jgi:hypothetical protein